MPVFRTVQDAQQGEIKLEAIHQPLYDSQDIAAAGDFSYFQSPAGRSQFLTNVQTAGQLSWPKRFSVKAVRLVPELGSIVADMISFYNNIIFRFNVGEKNYLTLPGFMLTPGVGLEVFNTYNVEQARATAAPTVIAHNGRPDHHNIYTLIHSIYIPPVQNFNVTLQVLATVTLSTTITTWIFLEGELLREIQ